ncbi:MAG TPA: FAD-dependent monooxygenase, partial [Luteimonas sp.]|nr:FAD-dependent monooxygenase [Luteimonas sp.]
RVEGVRLYAPNLRSMDLQSRGYYFLSTDTPAVMRWLAGELERAGAELRLMQSFTDARRSDAGWQVAGLGRCRWLVGADGAKSRVAMRAGLGRVRDFLYGVEHEFDGASLREPDRLHCFIDRQLAPGYIGWATQNPRGVQLGLAFRHRPDRTGVPDIARLREKAGEALGLDPALAPTATRAGLIPCGGPVRRLAAAQVILSGDAAGIVSPVTAGGIHSAWRHGEAVGTAIADHLLHGGPDPAGVAERAAPRYRGKRLLRRAFDHAQRDWPFNLLIGTPPLRWVAQRIYFHARGEPA